jgi:O-antigen/teichoic acid export membrane protein
VIYTWGAAASAIAATVFGVGYLLVVSPPAVDELRDWHGAAGPALFVFLCCGTALSLLLDVRLMTQRRWGLVLLRASLVGLARFPLLLLPVDQDRAVWLLTIAALPTAISGFVGTAWLPKVTGHGHVFGPKPSTAVAWARYSLVNWASTLTYQAPTFAMPVIVLANVSAEDNASFYVAWGVASVACFVPTAIGQALLAEGGRDGAHVRSQVRLAILVAGGLMVIGAVIATIGRDLIVTLYGEDYQDAADILPALVLAAVPWAVTSVYLTEARVRHRSAATVLITVVLSTAILVPALVLVPEDGIEGAATAFLFGNIVAALVALAAHLQIRRTADAPIPATSPDEFEPEDAIALTPNPLT